MWIIEYAGKWGSGLNGQSFPATDAELAQVLALRDPDGDAEFTLGQTGQERPALFLHVSNDQWYVHFFPLESYPATGYQSIGADTDTDEVHMPAGSNIYVSKYNLIDAETAYQAARQFISTAQRPTCLAWEDL